MSGDKARIDPRTFEVHQIPTLEPHSPRRPLLKLGQPDHVPRILSPRPQRTLMVKWLQSTTAIWEDVGFEDVPENDMDDMDDDGDVCSIDMGELLPLCLEAVPPFPKQGPDNTLFGLHQRIHHLGLSTGPIGDATYPPYVEDRYSVPRQLALDPSAYTFSSDNISSMTEDETCTKHVGKSIASKLRKAASQGVAACRMLREKWGR